MFEQATLQTRFDTLTLLPRAPVCLFKEEGHAVYWVGLLQEAAFRCNQYLIVDRNTAILVDPGGRSFFGQVRDWVAQVIDPARVSGMICCHQDPDVAASMPDWLAVNPAMRVFTTPRTQVLLPHYGRAEYDYYNVEAQPVFTLPSGRTLRFIPAPFLHFPGAFTTYDEASGFLFSGDIWAALDLDWTLVVQDFEAHVPRMNAFHQDYMTCNRAARGFVERLAGFRITAILPQHGSILGPRHVRAALDYLAALQCGVDLIYPEPE